MGYDIPEILDRLGVKIEIRGKNCAVSTDYRGGDTRTGLFVNEDGSCYDQIENRTFSLQEYVSAILGCSKKDAAAFLGSSERAETESTIEKIELQRKFSAEDIGFLTPSHKFYLDKGISRATLDTFKGGVCHNGKLFMRYVFPVYEKGVLRGANGRCLRIKPEEEKNYTASSRPFPKWKAVGDKRLFKYPLHLTSPFILKTKSLILIESIGDGLALWDAGVKNFLVIFGVALSDALLSALVAHNPRRIFLGLNNDVDKEVNRGQCAAVKVRKKLEKFFSPDKIIDAAPERGDFGDCTKEEIRAWAEKFRIELNGTDN